MPDSALEKRSSSARIVRQHGEIQAFDQKKFTSLGNIMIPSVLANPTPYSPMGQQAMGLPSSPIRVQFTWLAAISCISNVRIRVTSRGQHPGRLQLVG